MADFEIRANIVDILNEEIYPGKVTVEDEKIVSITRMDEQQSFENYILPGFIDAHVHIESSMLVPSEFARLAVVHGTVAAVSDPHEIANVLGVEGVKFMIENGNKVPFKFNFGAPSCVPATPFESAGAEIGPDDIRDLFDNYDIKYLSEMMNFPGVINEFPDVMEKLKIAKEYNKPIDGHSPGLIGDGLKKYVGAGISTDHESFSLDEAIDKIYNGMKILIREGSAAKNFDALYKLIETRPEMCMFCSDDKHPDDLVAGHINDLVRRSISMGFDLFRVLRVATKNAIEHYGLDVGLLRAGGDADFIMVNNLTDFKVLKTYIKGQLVAEEGKTLIDSVPVRAVNKFEASKKEPIDFCVPAGSENIRVIEAKDGELITEGITMPAKSDGGCIVPDIENDILKIAVVNRYEDAKPSMAFIKNFGLKRGAIASSVGHDSHNIIAVGTNDEDISKAVNRLVETQGGMVVVDGDDMHSLPLPVAGLMSDSDGYETARKYSELDKKAKELGSQLHAPFMTLSFMALLVIPKLKLSDKGLFDGEKFEFVELGV